MSSSQDGEAAVVSLWGLSRERRKKLDDTETLTYARAQIITDIHIGVKKPAMMWRLIGVKFSFSSTREGQAPCRKPHHVSNYTLHHDMIWYQHCIYYACNAVALLEHQRAQSAQPIELHYIESTLVTRSRSFVKSLCHYYIRTCEETESSGSQRPTLIIGIMLHNHVIMVKTSSSVVFKWHPTCVALIYRVRERGHIKGHFSHFGALVKMMPLDATDLIIFQSAIFPRFL